MDKANELVERWCADDEMWGTHGMPGEYKLKRLERDIATALRAAENDALERAAAILGPHSQTIGPAIRALKHPVE